MAAFVKKEESSRLKVEGRDKGLIRDLIGWGLLDDRGSSCLERFLTLNRKALPSTEAREREMHNGHYASKQRTSLRHPLPNRNWSLPQQANPYQENGLFSSVKALMNLVLRKLDPLMALLCLGPVSGLFLAMDLFVSFLSLC